MKLNITSQYAIRVLTYIAQNQALKYSTKEISHLLEIPYKSLARIVTQLVSAKIITSSRGREGGIGIERPLHEIRLIEILEAVKEEILDTCCILGTGHCNPNEKCALHDQWTAPKEAMMDMFNNTTLEMMINEEVKI